MIDYSLRERFVAALTAFKEPAVIAKLEDKDAFESWPNRRLRYAIYWAFYENTAYRPSVHKWSKTYRAKYGLYKYTRGIYNPAYRICEFWKSHLLGGALDAQAGDGMGRPSAIPIVIPPENKRSDDLRKALAQVWLWSNLAIKKDQFTLWGSVLGDVMLQVIDDPVRGKVYIEVGHPGILRDVDLDSYGNVKGYTFEYERPDPQRDYKKDATYTEVASRYNDLVVYETFRNNKPYAWDGEEYIWTEDYGFIPMVFVKHNDIGLKFGWSELHPGRGKFHEVDDLASKLSDHVRKVIDPIWLFSGVKKKSATVEKAETEPTVDRPQPGRDQIPAIYGPAGADAKPLIADLNIDQVLQHIGDIIEGLERDYPELLLDIWARGKQGSGAPSGKALRLARGTTTTKAEQRRPNYDDAIVRINQMAVAIGGYREYEGFEGFSLASYEAGELDHEVGKRPIFAQDPEDELDIEIKFWQAAAAADAAGMPLELWLEDQGWDAEKIAQVSANPMRQAKLQAILSLASMGITDEDEEPGEEPEEEGGEVS